MSGKPDVNLHVQLYRVHLHLMPATNRRTLYIVLHLFKVWFRVYVNFTVHVLLSKTVTKTKPRLASKSAVQNLRM